MDKQGCTKLCPKPPDEVFNSVRKAKIIRLQRIGMQKGISLKGDSEAILPLADEGTCYI